MLSGRKKRKRLEANLQCPGQRGQGGKAEGAGRWPFPPSQGLAQSAALSQEQEGSSTTMQEPPPVATQGLTPPCSGPAGSSFTSTPITTPPAKSQEDTLKQASRILTWTGSTFLPQHRRSRVTAGTQAAYEADNGGMFPLKKHWPHKQHHSEKGDT